MSKINALTQLEIILSKYLNFEKTPKKDALWLKNMETLCTSFDHPEKAYKTFHVAGSKGKGSTSTFIANILDAQNLSCGIFTSPHISDIVERLQSPKGPFKKEVYQKALTHFLEKKELIENLEENGGNKPTWFELFTLFSFLSFRAAKVNWAVFEVGLGGRLDSTNIITPEACLITPIELEHTAFLGDTIEKIAYEKAGIMKKGTPVFSSKQVDSVKKVFKTKANKVGAPLFFIDEIEDENFHNLFTHINKLNLKLKGSIQKENACLASFAVKSILPNITDDTILKGLSNAFLPGRFEVIKKNIDEKTLTLVLDGCHTPNSLSLCLETFYKEYRNDHEVLFACASDKDVENMAKKLKESPCAFSHISITEPGNVKQGDFARTEKAFSPHFDNTKLYKNADYTTCITQAIQSAVKNDKVLLCLGSFYLCAELKKFLK